jgi:hypothetical protein
MSDVVKRAEIGERIYRQILHSDKNEYWYEGYPVIKLTDKRVYFRDPHTGNDHFLKRGVLERNGIAIHRELGYIFVIEMPEDYRRGTLGYIMDEEPRKILGLKDKFTEQELEDVYRRRVKEVHPDVGGTPEEFKKINEAYEHLKDPNVLGFLAILLKNEKP